MKQLFESKELVGKTILKVIMPKESYQDMWIRFTDDSFVVLDMEDRTEGFGQEKHVIVISDSKVDDTSEELVELVFNSTKDYELALEKKEEEYQERVKMREAQELKRLEELEIKLLKELTNKHGDKFK